MKALYVLASAVTLLGTAVSSRPMTDESRETALWEMAKDKRMDAFAAQLDPGFVAVYADGVKDKSAEVSAIGEQNLTSFDISSFKSHPIDPNVVLVTYTVNAGGSYGNSDISGRYNVASLWRRSGNDWRLAYHSEVKAS